MYRISVTKGRDYSFVNAPGSYKQGYFGPCEKRDLNLFPQEVLSKFYNPENYIDFNMLAGDTSRRAQFVDFIRKYNIGNNNSYASFRNDRSFVVIFCKMVRKESNPDYIIFLRPEISALFGFENEPVLVNSWQSLSEKTRKLILDINYQPKNVYHVKSRFGKDIKEIYYTGNNAEILKWQTEILRDKPARLLTWARFLESDNSKKANQYASIAHIGRILNSTLSDDEKQKLINAVIEKYYYGMNNLDLENTKLYKYTVSEDSKNYDPKIAALTVSKIINEDTGFSRSRNIVTSGFTLSEWEKLVLKKSIPESIKKLPDQQLASWLNGSSDFSDRIQQQTYKIRYTGNNPLTIEKMRLTGLTPGVYYTKNDWYISLSKIRYVENILGIKTHKELKIKHTDPRIITDIMSEEYKDAFSRDIPLDQSLVTTVGNYFRQNANRFGVTANKDIVQRLIDEDADEYAINEELLKLQLLDNNFIDNLYTQIVGTNGEKVMLNAFSKNKNIEFQRSKSFNVTAPNGQSYTLIFDGAIYKDNKLVMLAEYQGSQHYHYNNLFFKDYDYFQERLYRDKLKLDFCRQNRIPLITISHLLSSDEAKIIYQNYLEHGINYLSSSLSRNDVPELSLNQENPEEKLNNYVDSIVQSHFSPILSIGDVKKLENKIKEIALDLSKLVMIMMSNLDNENLSDTSFIRDFNKTTLLDEGHKRVVDSFNKLFGSKFRMDYSDNVTYTKTILTPKTNPQISEFAFYKSFPSYKKKRYKIRVK